MVLMGFIFTPTGLNKNGYSVATAGDINGDGFSDLITGAYATSTNVVNSGASYVIFGGKGSWNTRLSLSKSKWQ